ncbi:hypothetical protein RirG_232810 [Rhizophagus irregularis DAOM 197198w]|uniref:Uncharacterized protein n=1 Tax=Rhizophagus irregularis (strain DAOM 197198w) TaxID=1432141 RepID=A0A015LIL6_RHIIW|nr:hypothetical protein RirG_232810 [Rhizophagus irregularis DAOM 197198w]
MKHRRQTRRQNCITYFHSNTLMQIPVSGTLTDDLFVLGQLIIERALKWYYVLIFFLNIWKDYIERSNTNTQYSIKWYSLQKSFISIQSYDTSMVESLIQQRVSYRDKISRAGIIDTNRERDSAAGYVFM